MTVLFAIFILCVLIAALGLEGLLGLVIVGGVVGAMLRTLGQ